MGRALLNGFVVEVQTILAPWVILSGWLVGCQVVIEGFGIDDFGLAGGLVEDGVR